MEIMKYESLIDLNYRLQKTDVIVLISIEKVGNTHINSLVIKIYDGTKQILSLWFREKGETKDIISVLRSFSYYSNVQIKIDIDVFYNNEQREYLVSLIKLSNYDLTLRLCNVIEDYGEHLGNVFFKIIGE